MSRKMVGLLSAGACLLVSANCGAATITFYDYDNFAWTAAPTLGANIGNAWLNHNWGQNANALTAAGPTGGIETGTQPTAYSIWKVTAPEGQLLTSLNVHTRANFEKDTSKVDVPDMAYVEYSLSPDGAWTRLYNHQFNAEPWTQDDKSATITLTSPVADVYVRMAATKYDGTYYWVGDYVKNNVVLGRQSNLRFTDLRITGETAAVPEATSLGLLGVAALLVAGKRRV